MSHKNNLTNIQKSIQAECDSVGRSPDDVTLISVSKHQPIERIQSVLDIGHRVFGENRVQEAQEHWAELRNQYPDLKLHLIGPLQTNKVKDAVELFDVIHTVDRPKLATALAEEMHKTGKKIPCFIQVNTGEEDQKSGVTPDDLPELLRFSRDECGLNIIGLMCIPPIDEPPIMHFALLQKLAHENSLSELSMGMSSDYDKAVRLGATYIRVGSALFGER